jgi:hypothetical protein
MAETNNYGFKKRASGDMIFGKDINDILDDIDARLYAALGTDLVQESGVATAVNWGAMTADWNNLVLLDDEAEIKFASAGNLSKVRILVPSTAAPASGTLDIALARASAPTTPITPLVNVGSAGIDTIVSPASLTAIAADEELVVIANNSGTATGTGGTIEVSVELNIPTSS